MRLGISFHSVYRLYAVVEGMLVPTGFGLRAFIPTAGLSNTSADRLVTLTVISVPY